MRKIKYLIALSYFPKFGPVRLKRIKKYFSKNDKTLKNGFYASSSELTRAGIEQKIADEFIEARKKIEPERVIENIEKENIKIVSIEDNIYPKLLKEIYDPPLFFYYKGEFGVEDEFSIAVVGSRKCSNYGKQVVEQIVKELALNNITIVSGLALGIDALSHQATVEAKGRTIAVLGSGLDKNSIYPFSNRNLADKIIENNGVVMSEFPLGTAPLRYNFPQRNRIISGLSLGALVIEAGEKSGSLITSRFALEQNREVFAVPGNIYSPISMGPNDLIKQGAKLVTTALDIIETLDLTKINVHIENKKLIPESVEEEKILKHLTKVPMHINNLIQITELDTAKISSALTIMEMKGMVKNLGNMQYVLK